MTSNEKQNENLYEWISGILGQISNGYPLQRSALDIKNIAPKSEGYSDKIQIFFQRYGRFSKTFVNLKKSRH
jgi:hypothetical protein